MSADITITWVAGQNTLTAQPPEYHAGRPTGRPVHITWDFAGAVQSITVSIDTFKAPSEPTPTPYTGAQPTWDGEDVTWHDPDRVEGATYEYTVSAYVTGVGARTLDPKIINT